MLQKNKKTLLVKIGLLLGVVILFTALGCKKSTPEPSETTESPTETPSITYPANEAATETANEAISTTEETISPSPTATTASPTVSPTTSPITSPTASPSPTTTAAATPTPEPKTSDEETILKQQAEKLAEIYGTYTNKDKEPYKNLKDLKKYGTTKFQAWLDLQMKKTLDSQAPFYGATTKTLSSAILESSGNAKKILVTVKKEEISAKRETPQVSYKLILLNFIKEKEEWKLDGIYWQ